MSCPTGHRPVAVPAWEMRSRLDDQGSQWVIYRSGSSCSDIVDNDLGSMGAVTVKVSKGQDFQSSRCGDWKKVG